MKQLLQRWTTLASILAAVLIVVAIVVFSGWFSGDKDDAGGDAEIKGTATVTTAEAAQGSLSPTTLAYGTVTSSPAHTYVIALMRDGIFKSVDVHDGDPVRAGQALFTVSTAPANLTAYAQAKSAVDFATQDLARVERMFANRLATNDQLATARKALADAKSQLDEQNKIGAGAAEQVIRAPFDGVVSGLMAVPGDKVQANTTIATVSSRSDVVVQLNVEPEDASKLMVGATVKLISSFSGSDTIEGKLTSVGATIDPMTHLVKAVAQIPAAAGAHLTLGSTLVAHIDLPPRQGILVPRTALLEDDSGPYIFTISENTAHKQNIKVLVETDDMALIDGVDPALGTKVVIAGNAELDDDTPVQESKS
jgi:RND family efflux transporter MFP subunit